MSARVFVDTSAYFALADVSEGKHSAALTAAQRLENEGAQFYTTTFIVAEVHALLVKRAGRAAALRMLDRLYASSTKIIRATEADETRARAILHQNQDKDYSFADAVSFAVMGRLHLRLAWTYDHHFAQFGFTLAE